MPYVQLTSLNNSFTKQNIESKPVMPDKEFDKLKEDILNTK